MSTVIAEARPPLVAAPPRGEGVVRLAQRGDEKARDELARSCQRTAFLFALHLTGDREAAMDLAQEAMLRFFGSIARFDPERPVRPWLLRIVRNLARDRGRRRRVRRIESTVDTEVLAAETADPGPGPEAAATRHELQRLLWSVARRLPAKQREVLALRDYLGLSYREIATALGIPRGTVMSRLHRARTMLRHAVEERLGEVGNG